jgi:hypothetical protein
VLDGLGAQKAYLKAHRRGGSKNGQGCPNGSRSRLALLAKIRVHHELDELLELHFRIESETSPGLADVADQILVFVGRISLASVDRYFPGSVDDREPITNSFTNAPRLAMMKSSGLSSWSMAMPLPCTPGSQSIFAEIAQNQHPVCRTIRAADFVIFRVVLLSPPGRSWL